MARALALAADSRRFLPERSAAFFLLAFSRFCAALYFFLSSAAFFFSAATFLAVFLACFFLILFSAARAFFLALSRRSLQRCFLAAAAFFLRRAARALPRRSLAIFTRRAMAARFLRRAAARRLGARPFMTRHLTAACLRQCLQPGARNLAARFLEKTMAEQPPLFTNVAMQAPQWRFLGTRMPRRFLENFHLPSLDFFLGPFSLRPGRRLRSLGSMPLSKMRCFLPRGTPGRGPGRVRRRRPKPAPIRRREGPRKYCLPVR